MSRSTVALAPRPSDRRASSPGRGGTTALLVPAEHCRRRPFGGRSTCLPVARAPETGLLLLVALLSAGPAAAFTDDECMQCHSDPGLVRTTADGHEVPLQVDLEAFGRSVHAGLSCVDCHGGIEELPHPERLAPVDCGSCHGDVSEVYDKSSHGKAVAGGSALAAHCYDCHGKHDIRSPRDDESPTSHFRLVETCARCHADPAVTEALPFGKRAPVEGYLKSVHGKALLETKDPNAPNCGTCHPAHEVLPPADPASLVNPVNLPRTCAQCHGEVYEIYAESIHGQAAARGTSGAPTCVDCHGEHQIEGPRSPTSTVFPANIARTTCPACHASEAMGTRYGFDATRFASYRQTYHGLATRRGDLSVANCASCHGVHNIFRTGDPRSTVNPANLTETCGHCHPNANERFAAISVHPKIGGSSVPAEKPPAEVVRVVYVLLLLTVVGGMAVHNGIIWWHHVVEKVRRERKHAVVRRFTKLEAIEHQLNLIAFFILVFTGFALKFPDAGWVRLTEKLGLSESLRGLTHRVAAVVMIAVALVHTGWFLLTRRGRRELLHIIPRLSDARDFLHNMAYHLNLRTDRPRFPRFDYTEKAEYLALIWGTSVMILTGLILWFPTIAMRYLPGWAFSVAEVIHYYEAWLAFLAIIVWHLFFVILHPDIYPINLTFLGGRTTVEHALHKHGSIEAATGGHETEEPVVEEPR